ncbi:MAG TPA: response regulator, partial [Rhodocyclaceae bacterium]|nr:response regulator [Rhodocyclaceae bacterium]
MRLNQRPLSMMIVDDSTVIRNRIARLVSNPQLPLIRIAGLAANGEVALQMARETRPDLITMDLTMPNMDGEAC